MRPLVARDFDGMTDFDDVQLVGIECFSGENIETGGSGSRCAARHPASRATDDKSHDSGSGGHCSPGPSVGSLVLEHLVKLEPLRHWLFKHRAIAPADAPGLVPPRPRKP